MIEQKENLGRGTFIGRKWVFAKGRVTLLFQVREGEKG